MCWKRRADTYTWNTVALVWKLPLPMVEAKTVSEQ